MSFSLSFVPSSFTTSRGGLSQWSAPFLVTGVRWHAASRTILLSGSDGATRSCRVDRLGSSEDASALMRIIRQARSSGMPVSVAAAGNNSTARWFCAVSVQAA